MNDVITTIKDRATELFEGEFQSKSLKSSCEKYLAGDKDQLTKIIERLKQSGHEDAEEFILALSKDKAKDAPLEKSPAATIPANTSSAATSHSGKNKTMPDSSCAAMIQFVPMESLREHPKVVGLFKIDDDALLAFREKFRSGYDKNFPLDVIDDGAGKYQVIDGYTRWTACKDNPKITEVPVLIHNFKSDQAILDFVFQTQCHRRQNMPSVLIPAIEYYSTIEAAEAKKRQGTRTDLTAGSKDNDVGGKANDFIARRLGISPATVGRIKNIINHQDIKAQVIDGTLKVSAALATIKQLDLSRPSSSRSSEPKLTITTVVLEHLLTHLQAGANERLKEILCSCPKKTKQFIEEKIIRREQTLSDPMPSSQDCIF